MNTKTNRDDLLDRLADGVANLVTTDRWRTYLSAQAKFHQYSFGNTILILSQRPDATQVASFTTWKRLGRIVAKGESAIWITAPVTVKTTDDNGDDERRLRGFRWVPVFDIAQTSGDEIPAPVTHLVGGDPDQHYEALTEVAESIGFTVEDHHFAGGPNGDCSHNYRRIRVEATNSPAQRIKTLAHELGHAILHEEFTDRPLAELEAESVAYIVCATLGINSDDYSFGYVASWAGSADNAVSAIKTSGDRINRAARTILATVPLRQPVGAAR